MVFNIVTTVIFGLVYLLVLVVCTQDIEGVLNTNFATAAIQVFVNAVGNSGAIALTALIVVMAFMAGLSNLTITARVGWAMARDGAFPGSDWLKVVHPTTKSPYRMVLLILIIDLVLLLIPLGSSLAFAAVTSISTVGYQASYLIPIVLRLTSGKHIFTQDRNFNLGRFSVPLNIISLVFLGITTVFLFFPQASPITADNFNWALAVTPAFFLVAIAYWAYWAKDNFKGPVHTLEKDNKVIELEKVQGEDLMQG